ncbi:hypothetical protein [Streptomyces sp. NPDC060194]|uniref:hypothetical protein n=1 Tax=Streptomyces sp. NPDC060194 TaxID=3347069 RepID=UPI00365F0162
MCSPVRAARPATGLVRGVVEAERDRAFRLGLPVDEVGLMLVARSVGLPGEQALTGIVGRPSAEAPVEVVLARVPRVTAVDPPLGGHLLELCLHRRGRRDSRHRIAAVLGDHRFLTDAVAAASGGRTHTAITYYGWLLQILTGSPVVQRKDVEDVMQLVGYRPPPALVIAMRNASRGSAAAAVDAIAAAEYYRHHQSPPPAPPARPVIPPLPASPPDQPQGPAPAAPPAPDSHRSGPSRPDAPRDHDHGGPAGRPHD